ncbi:MAG: hypothetical protein KDA91_01130 [Planctomycetaceae bacterium]|nr:hypothetical protein [Planctomycetaceae bacterium]
MNHTSSELAVESADACDSHCSRQPVILLGASNLTIGWKPLLRALTSRVDRAVDVFASLGMGRSYVDWSAFGFRRLPGISKCGIWHSLRQQYPQPEYPPLVLFTDVGNDLVYGRSPDNVMTSIRDCIEQLMDWNPDCHLVFTGLPLHSVNNLSRIRFSVARAILFPGSGLQLRDVQRNANLLDELVQNEARQWKASFVQPEPNWYGLDPIHVRRRYREEAFRRFFDHWPQQGGQLKGGTESFTSTMPALPVAEVRELWGRIRSVPQPCFDSPRLRVFGF